ncbi:GNAT family N-acetyltransferase [Dysgonomonas sp. Marseille-P4361]|uniref:GNAT family N-acetyltransferase n=1 Tax=Dysgonomonas sp. Marseille-P4361 TaxID=2161820 RepID=UPI000D54B7AC|nr:GNAT family N-acetyltransferase [Dysgonomonas sp. Marseille-P4361]
MIIAEVPYTEVLELRQQVMYPDKDIEFVKLPDDTEGLHIGVYEQGVLISVMSLFMNKREIQFRKLATLTDMQKKGYASALMRWLINYANDIKAERIWCNARVNASDFYKRFGYQDTDVCFSKNGYDYIIMERKIS